MDRTIKGINPYLKCMFSVVDCIADLFGPNCEVVLHDIADPEHSIIKIRNSHVTGRKVGDPLTDIGLEMIRDAEKGLEILGNYNPRTKSGRLLKSNAVNIRNPRGNLIGILCINFDVSRLQQFQKTVEQLDETMQAFAIVKEEPAITVKEEHFESDMWTILQDMIEKQIKEIAKPADQFTKEDRLNLIYALNEKGIFFVKGAVHLVAKSLGISSPTIYRYLEEARFPARETKS